MPIRLAITALLTLALLAVGCGSDDASERSDAPLSAKQHAQIERLIRDQLAIERATKETAPGLRRMARQMTASCERVDESDRLLAAMVKGCAESAEMLVSMSELDCDEPKACARGLHDTARMLGKLIAFARDSDETIRQEVDDEVCRDSLVTPPDAHDAFAGMRRAALAVADAFEAEDYAAADRALNRLGQATEDLEKVASARQLLDRFNRDCGTSA